MQYLNIVGEPEKVRICVLNGEEDVPSRDDLAFGNGFDPDGKTTIVFLTMARRSKEVEERK